MNTRWDPAQEEPYRSKTDLTANNHLASLERLIDSLREENRAQADELKSIAWMCKDCSSTFPSMLVRQNIDGRLTCPRCGAHGTILRAHEALQAIMKEKTRQVQTDATNQELMKKELKRLEAINVALEMSNKHLKEENDLLRETNKKLRIRPVGGRAVEGDDHA